MSVLVEPGETNKRLTALENKVILLFTELATLKRRLAALERGRGTPQVRGFHVTEIDGEMSQLDDQGCCVS